MDVFKFISPVHPTRLDQGKLINGLKTKLWVERYRDASDFEFTANLDTLVHKELPVGTLISHVNTTEVMVVENHEINEDVGKESEVKITGRSFESFLENRIVGSNQTVDSMSATAEHILPPDNTWNQAVKLVQDHVYESRLVDINDAILNFHVMSSVVGIGEVVERTIKRGSLYSRMIELLALENLGVKTIRPGWRSPLSEFSANMVLVVHKGEDLSKEVVFTFSSGDIESSDYLKTNKKLKNAALVTGRWLETVVRGPESDYNRRMMHVDASDIDSAFTSAPTGTAKTKALAAMSARGKEALAAQKEITFLKAEPKKNSVVHKYREDYDLGDTITVAGAYDEATSKKQVSEYVEVEDETGRHGYPTLIDL